MPLGKSELLSKLLSKFVFYKIMEESVPWIVWTQCLFKLMGPYGCTKHNRFAATKCCGGEPYEIVFFCMLRLVKYWQVSFIQPGISNLTPFLCLSFSYFAMDKNILKVVLIENLPILLLYVKIYFARSVFPLILSSPLPLPAVSQGTKVKVKERSLSRVPLFATPWTVTYQAPPSMGFSRQEYWSG